VPASAAATRGWRPISSSASPPVSRLVRLVPRLVMPLRYRRRAPKC
jgi:hypothetical protein